MDNLYIVMPAYNEEENISNVIKQWYPLLCDKGELSRLVVADSGSTDATHSILKELQKTLPKLVLLENTDKQHGPKLMALYNYAICQESDFIFQTDSDGQTNPEEFTAFWEMRNMYNGIFGYRKKRGDGKIRAFVEYIVCVLLKIFFHVNIPDANAPFRLMKTKSVKKYLYKLPLNYNIPNIMITTYFMYFKEKVAFKQISFKPRQCGINSINIPKIIKIGWKSLGEFYNLKRQIDQ